MNKTWLSSTATALLVASLAVMPATAANHPADPSRIVAAGIQEVLLFMERSPTSDERAMRKFLDERIAPSFDFDYMARWSAGSYLRRLEREQLERLGELVRSLFISALARNLGAFANPVPVATVLRARPGRDRREQVVPAMVRVRPGWTVRLDFRCYWNGSSWRVFDVSANGASAVSFFRQYISERLRREGPTELLKP